MLAATNSGEVNCPTSVVSLTSDATTVARSLKSVLKLFLLDGNLIGVLTADFDERLGLITCERSLLGHSAKEETSLRSDAGVLLIPLFSRGVSARGGVDQNDENGLGEENGDSSNVPRSMRLVSDF